MPELPEVTTIVKNIKKELVGRDLLRFSSSEGGERIKPSASTIKERLEGEKLVDAKRIAKYIVLDFGNNLLLIHLRMTGRLIIAKPGSKKLRWERARFDFQGGKSVRFEDLRRFGTMELVKKGREGDFFGKVGEDALQISKQDFWQAVRKRKIAIKKLLLDQKVMSGVGNIYASEALFLAKINPEKIANMITRQQSDQLLEAVKKVLKVGIASGGATLADDQYRDLYGKEGGYIKHVLVYDRRGKSCKNRCGAKVEKKQLGGRGTYFCPRCQRL